MAGLVVVVTSLIAIPHHATNMDMMSYATTKAAKHTYSMLCSNS